MRLMCSSVAASVRTTKTKIVSTGTRLCAQTGSRSESDDEHEARRVAGADEGGGQRGLDRPRERLVGRLGEDEQRHGRERGEHGEGAEQDPHPAVQACGGRAAPRGSAGQGSRGPPARIGPPCTDCGAATIEPPAARALSSPFRPRRVSVALDSASDDPVQPGRQEGLVAGADPRARRSRARPSRPPTAGCASSSPRRWRSWRPSGRAVRAAITPAAAHAGDVRAGVAGPSAPRALPRLPGPERRLRRHLRRAVRLDRPRHGRSRGWRTSTSCPAGKPRLLYVRRAAPGREPRLDELIVRMQAESGSSTTPYDDPERARPSGWPTTSPSC